MTVIRCPVCGGEPVASGWYKCLAPPIKHYECASCTTHLWFLEDREQPQMRGEPPLGPD